MTKDLFIVGAGSVGGYIVSNISSISGDYQIAGFFDDDPDLIGKTKFGINILGSVNDLMKLKFGNVIIGISYPSIKAIIVQKLIRECKFNFPSLISNHCWISNDCTIGKGVVIYPGTTINYGSFIGDHVIINMNCAIGHNCSIGTYSSISPGVNLGGYTKIGEFCEIGIGASTKQNINIGDRVIVGGQSMIISDCADDSKMVGVPGKLIER